MSFCVSGQDWERMWAPYDEPTYKAVLQYIRPQDIIIEIGAGDLRLANRIAAIARQVYAVDINPSHFPAVQAQGIFQPRNLTPVVADARTWPLPPHVTAGVLLMRHCSHFQLYAEKLKAAGARCLITNARWGMGIECLDLRSPRYAYGSLPLGWYACWCGAVGFKIGPVELLTPQAGATTYEVKNCPRCQ